MKPGGLGLILVFAVVGAIQPGVPTQAPEYTYRVLNVFPHDTSAFTEGLEYRSGFLYESTGLNGHSTLRKVDLPTGKIVQETNLDPQYFGEGITVLNGRIFQLTWLTQTGFIYNQPTFGIMSTFSYTGQGWGMTNDGSKLYTSDGTDQIHVRDPSTLAEIRRISVHENSTPIQLVNELEWVRGLLYANVWQTDKVAIIDPADGRVIAWIDLAGLLTPAERAQADVLNGIAYDIAGDRLFVTGKLWPKLFQIQLMPRASAGRRHV